MIYLFYISADNCKTWTMQWLTTSEAIDIKQEFPHFFMYRRISKSDAAEIYKTPLYSNLCRVPGDKTPEKIYPFPFAHNDMYTFDRYVELLEKDPELSAPYDFYIRL